jgi:CheY-like chemotaxis protein
MKLVPRLLVAEDDGPLREILQEGLESEGFAVVAASDGAHALELFDTTGPFDALVLDHEMPHLTGRELLARLRARGERVVTLLVSGTLELPEDERARLGVGALLRKPVSIGEIARALRQALAAAAP